LLTVFKANQRLSPWLLPVNTFKDNRIKS